MIVTVGEVRSVLHLGRDRRRVRPWIAMMAAYALALQLLLTGIAAAHAVAADEAPAGDLFVVCHGSGDSPAVDQDGTAKPPVSRSSCVLCTLTSASCAALPADPGISIIDTKLLSDVFAWNDAPRIKFDSPTGQYPRGPPAPIRIGG
jgi:hypothetical protein